MKRLSAAVVAALVVLAASWGHADNYPDRAPGSTVCFIVTTTNAAGAGTDLSGGTVSIYKGSSSAESTTGVTITPGFDSRTGSLLVCVDTSTDGTFYSAGSCFSAMITAGTVNSVSFVSYVVGSFCLQTASIASVSGATGSVTGAVGSVTGAVGSVTGNVGGNVVGSVASVSGNVGGNIVGTVASVVGNVGGNITGNVTGNVSGNVTGNVGGNVVGSVASVAGSVGSIASGGITSSSFAAAAVDAAAIAPNAIGASELADNAIDAGAIATDAVTEIAAGISAAPSAATVADAVLDELLSGHAIAGSAGSALSAAGTSADPWMTPLPGSYADDTAGDIVGNLLLRLQATGVTIVSPFDPTTGKLRLTRGDDYPASEEGAIPPFVSSDWSDLTGADIVLTIRTRVPATGLGSTVLMQLSDTEALRVAGAGEQSITFEPLSAPGSPVVNAQTGGTASLVPGVSSAKFDIQATLASGAVKTLAAGLVDVVEDITH